MDSRLLRDSFAAVAPQAGEMVEYFYGHLFAAGGAEVIDLFPPDMAYVREHLTAAVAQVVAAADDPQALVPVLAALGRAHRKLGVSPRHFELVGASLLAALERYAGPAWTPEAKASWAEAYALVSGAMQQGIKDDIRAGHPAWHEAVVTSREMRTYDIVALTARLARPLDWAPGQSVPVRFEDGPAIWRPLTPANSPRVSRTLDFHVRVVPGGLMSVALALRAEPGTRLRIGPPVGTLALDESSERDIVLAAGSTGLTPMLAMLDRLAARPAPPDVRLYFGARSPEGLYELDRLAKLANELPWLTLTHCAETWDDGYDGERGSVVDVMARGGSWAERDAYVCGPAKMVQAAAGRLMALGVPGAQVHVESFGREG